MRVGGSPLLLYIEFLIHIVIHIYIRGMRYNEGSME